MWACFLAIVCMKLITHVEEYVVSFCFQVSLSLFLFPHYRFISDEEVLNRICSTFTGLYTLDKVRKTETQYLYVESITSYCMNSVTFWPPNTECLSSPACVKNLKKPNLKVKSRYFSVSGPRRHKTGLWHELLLQPEIQIYAMYLLKLKFSLSYNVYIILSYKKKAQMGLARNKFDWW